MSASGVARRGVTERRVGFGERAVNGWSVSSLTQVRSGSPFTPTFSIPGTVAGQSTVGWYATRANVVANVNPYANAHTRTLWFNPAAFAPTARLLGEVRGPETHVLLRSDDDYEAGKALITVLSGPLKPSRILVTGADRDVAASGPVSLSLEYGIPISFVADGPNANSGVHPAEADELGDLAYP